MKVTPNATVVEVKKGMVRVKDAEGESEARAGRTIVISDGRLPVVEKSNRPGSEEETGKGKSSEESGVSVPDKPADPSLLAYWKFDEGEGKAAHDETVYEHHGTITGAEWVEGKFASALAFDGVSAYVDVGNPRKLRLTGSFTVTAWIYVNNFETNGRIISKQGGPGNRGWSLNIEKQGYAAFQVPISQDDMVHARTPRFPSGVWVHLAGVYDMNRRRVAIFLNGKPVDITTHEVPMVMYDSPLGVRIGCRPANGCPFYGKIDEVRIYARPLSIAGINAVMRGDVR